MPFKHPTFSLGIEEEYYLVNTETRDLAANTPSALLSELEERLGRRFSTEYMSSQIEVCTSVCQSLPQARTELLRLRQSVSAIASPHGLAPVAASTHPFGRWNRQKHRDTPRYNAIAQSFQGVGRRMVINGLHIHVGLESDAVRIDVMNRIRPYLPVLLALTTSSPFWQGRKTGLKSFRTAINDSTPRKGIPEEFESWEDYQAVVGQLISNGSITDATEIWWDLRPSVRFPTIEMRICDICPMLDDGICVAALFRCLCRYLYRTRRERQSRAQSSLLLINENRWRAERYGMEAGLIHPGTGRVADAAGLIEDLIETVRVDAAFFGCEDEVAHARRIVARGSSADRQVALYRRLRNSQHSHKAALAGVVDMLIGETAATARRRSGLTERDAAIA